MYTDEDLNIAVQKGIFSDTSVSEFRENFTHRHQTNNVDDENFRMVSGFNDIFVVIACALLLYSSYSVLGAFNDVLSHLSVPILTWGLAEFFIRKRKMALPAILLMLAFVAGVYYLVQHLLTSFPGKTYIAATACAAIAAFIHYQRFKVPVTIAAGIAAITGFIVALLMYYIPSFSTAGSWIQATVFVCGIGTFILAMFWDASDLQRVTHRTDVAFWLHLLSAPMIVHPVFAYLGILEGHENPTSIIVVILLYLLMTLISIVIDRRAFMVSSLLYVMYALSNLFTLYGIVGYNLAATGVCLGGGLLLLSAFWQQARRLILLALPNNFRQFLPASR